MKELNLDPFIRFAMRMQVCPQPIVYVPLDTHLYYIIEGKGRITIDSEEYSFEAGNAILVPSGHNYVFSVTGITDILSINFDFTKINKGRTEPIHPIKLSEYKECDSLFDGEYGLPLCEPKVFKPSASFTHCIMRVIDEFSLKKKYYRDSASAYLKSALIELCRTADGVYSGKADRMIEYIKEHFTEPISNKALAALFGYHPYHVNRIMKAAVGTTVHNYIIELRLDKAKLLLSEDRSSIAEIADLCGYGSLSSFSAEFKHRTGISPIKYREHAFGG